MRESTRSNWVRDGIFYEIFPERFYNGDKENDPPNTETWGSKPLRRNFFGGDLKGITGKLSYLDELGVNALYLTPIFDAPSNHKYDTRDYLKVDEHFGNLGILKELVEEAHSKGIKIILDGVFNHTGDKFWAFRDVVEHGKKSEYSDWYFVESFPLKKRPVNYKTCGGASYLPKLNTDNPKVKEYLFKVAKYWLEEADIDGWRLDVPFLISPEFWQEFRTVVKSIKPDAYIVGEIWRDARPWLKDGHFDGVMNYQLRNLIIEFFVHRKIDSETFNYELKVLRESYSLETSYNMLNLLGSHDTSRFLTISRGDVDKAVISLLFMMTYIGAPMIYYGDELGMQGGNDPSCRGTMIWDRKQWDHTLFKMYKRMIKIRKQHPALRRGTFETLYKDSTGRIYAYKRSYSSDLLIVVINSGLKERTLRIPIDSTRDKKPQIFKDILNGSEYSVCEGELIISHLQGKSGLLLKAKT